MSMAYLLFLLLCIEFFCQLEASTSANKTIGRPKREFEAKYLIFPQGSNVQLVYCMTINTYSKPSGFFTMGVTAGQAWELPSESMVSREDSDEAYHRRSRRELYRKVELLLGTQGRDGRACVLKAICKASKRNLQEIGTGTFLEEILHSVFSLPEHFGDTDSTADHEKTFLWKENCDELESRCPDVF